MKSLNIAEDISAAAASTASTPVDLAAQNEPFTPGNTVVAALNLQAVADAQVIVEESDDVTFATGVNDLFTYDNDAGSAISKVVFATITPTLQYVRLNCEEATTGAGAASLDFLNN